MRVEKGEVIVGRPAREIRDFLRSGPNMWADWTAEWFRIPEDEARLLLTVCNVHPFRHVLLFPLAGFSDAVELNAAGWRRIGRGKIPMRVRTKDQKPFTMAGLWDLWRDPDGEELYSFTIITTQPTNCSARSTTAWR